MKRTKLVVNDATIELVYGDVLDVLVGLPDESIDLVIADPPYNSRVVDWDYKDDNWQLRWLAEVKRIMKDGASIYVFFAPLNMYVIEGWVRENLTLKNICVWYHPNLYGAGLSYGKDRYKSSWDVVFYATKGGKAKHGMNVSSVAYQKTGKGLDVFVYPQPRPLLHKAQKPLDLIRKFVICSSLRGEWILDPFVGVETTAIACALEGRNCIGIDNVKEFLGIAEERLRGLGQLKEIDRGIKKRLKGGDETCVESNVIFAVRK